MSQTMREALALAKEAIDAVKDWSGYAGDYFKEKHKLAEELAEYRARLAALSAPSSEQAQQGAAIDRDEQTTQWVADGGFFHRFGGEDHACMPLSAWRASRPAAAAAPAVEMTDQQAQVLEKLIDLARLVDRAVDDWGETVADGSSNVIFHKDVAEERDAILEFFDGLPENPDPMILDSGPMKAKRVLAALTGAAQPEADCNNDQCGWSGPLSETCRLGSIGPLCPNCRETVEAGAAQGAGPVGWRLVPIVATPEMVANAMRECGDIGAGSCGEHSGADGDDMRSVWDSMLAAAPQPGKEKKA